MVHARRKTGRTRALCVAVSLGNSTWVCFRVRGRGVPAKIPLSPAKARDRYRTCSCAHGKQRPLSRPPLSARARRVEVKITGRGGEGARAGKLRSVYDGRAGVRGMSGNGCALRVLCHTPCSLCLLCTSSTALEPLGFCRSHRKKRESSLLCVSPAPSYNSSPTSLLSPSL